MAYAYTFGKYVIFVSLCLSIHEWHACVCVSDLHGRMASRFFRILYLIDFLNIYKWKSLYKNPISNEYFFIASLNVKSNTFQAYIEYIANPWKTLSFFKNISEIRFFEKSTIL